ncbi:ABC transporter permease [Gallicola sp. Sow4_E12]|uniref:ABC transporter permease n=1 Tax=Gallicola sp. Sow4_E12 TaxID=3438785 RepID=UPI003F8D9677
MSDLTKTHNSKFNFRKFISSQQGIALIVLIILYGFFYLRSGAFRSGNTLASIFDSSYYAGFLAIGVTFAIATGGFDMSIGAVMNTSALIGGYFAQKAGLPVGVALIITLIIGTVFGALNGALITKARINPFVTTLATQMLAVGLGSIITQVQTVNYPLRTMGEGWYKSIFKLESGFPTGIIVLAVVAILMGIILKKTKFGRYLLALGSNEEAARLSGINTDKYKFLAYTLCGFFAGLAGIAYAATYTTIMPGEGVGFELDAIAAAVIGGSSLAGGIAGIGGTIIGLFIMTILKVGLPFIGLQAHYQTFITGIVLLVAVYLDVIRNRKK